MDNILKLEDVIGDQSLSTEVPHSLNVELDLGNLLATDSSALPKADNINEISLKDTARDATQVIVNELWRCPREIEYDDVVAVLPKPYTEIPREKPVPKPKPPTKWEQFAKEKGIKKRKKSTKVWDDVSKSWKFSWGYRKKLGEKEYKDYDEQLKRDMEEDMQVQNGENKKKHLTKKERMAKNELSRLRNIARAKKSQGVEGVLPLPAMNSKYIPLKSESKKALSHATASTASLGKFTAPLKSERKQKKYSGGKTKLIESQKSLSSEKDSFLKIVDSIKSKKEAVDSQLAAKVFEKRDRDKSKEPSKERKSKTQIKKSNKSKVHAGRKTLEQMRKKQKSNFDGVKGGKVTKKKVTSNSSFAKKKTKK